MGAAGSASAPAEMRNARARSSAAYAPSRPAHRAVCAASAPDAVRRSAQSGAAPPVTRPASTVAPRRTHPTGPRTAAGSLPARSTSTVVSSPETRSSPGTCTRPGTAAGPQAARAAAAMNSARRISPKLYTIGGGACSFSDICREMRLSIATKVFLGFAAVVVMSGAVSLFGIVQMHRIGQGLALVSSGYFPLTRIAASLEGFQRERERSTDGLLAERDPAQRKSLVGLDRTYLSRVAEDHLTRAREQLQLAREGASARDRAALDRIDARLQLLSARVNEEDQLARSLADLLAREGRVAAVDLPAAQDLIARLKTSERRVGYEIRTLLNVIQEQMNGGLAEAERQERTARWAIVGLSVLALGIGLLVTWLSNRALAPIARLTEAAQRLGRGAPDAVAVPEGGGDELAVLAREFNAMAQRLAARERELRAQGEALVRSERLAAIGRIAAQITHEIRNPLSSISLNAEELAERLRELRGAHGGDGAPAAALCDAIVREVDRLAAVTEEY